MKTSVLSAVLALVLLAGSASAVNYDVAILNFALQLEYLEANFYSCAAFGVPLAANLIGSGGVMATGCTGKALLSPAVLALATEIAKDEIAHVAFLRSALGAAAVPQPAINIGATFAAAANAAFGTTLPVPFTAYGSDVLFLLSAFIFEDVGVTAYKGAAPLLTNVAFVGPAAGILAVEGYHAGAIRACLLGMKDAYVFPYATTVSGITTAIANLRAAVDGLGKDDFGITASTGATIIAPVDTNAIAFGRAPKNVLPIIYLGGTSKGGFFPNGLLGIFNSTLTTPV